ncbi:CHAT domain-containing protein [Hyphomicrobium sp.]|uniref:CHAT domain-containing protein n=1 Tax=Hyphomicrobium sp. TaxID=82 RepID=UPI002FE2597C
MGGDSEIAELVAEIAACVRATPEDRLRLSDLRYRLAEHFRAAGRLDESLQETEACLDLLAEFPSEHFRATCAHRCHSQTVFRKGQLGAYAVHAEGALARFRQIPTRSDESMIDLLMDAALARSYTGQNKAAIAACQEALRIANEVAGAEHVDEDVRAGVAQRAMTVRRRFAMILKDEGALRQAELLFEACKPDAAASVDDRLSWLNGRAILAEYLDEEDVANASYCAYVRLVPRRASWNVRAIYGVSNAATWFLSNGALRIGLAMRDYFERLASRAAPEAVAAQIAMINAVWAEADGRLETAAQEFAAAARLAEAEEDGEPAALLVERAAILTQIGRWEEARQSLRPLVPQTIDYRDRHAMSAAIRLGLLLSEPEGEPTPGDIRDATEILRATFLAESRRGSAEGQWRLLSGLAEVAASRGRDQAAILFGKAAASLLRISAFAAEGNARQRRERRLPLQRLATRLVDATQFPQAARVQARTKQEIAYDLLRRDQDADPRGRDVPLTDAEAALLAELARHQAAIQALEPDFSEESLALQHVPDPEETIRREGALLGWIDNVLRQDWVVPRGAGAPTSHEAAPQPDCVEVDFLRGETSWIVWARSAAGERRFAVAAEARHLARGIFAFRQHLIGLRPDWEDAARALYDLIVRPLEGMLAGPVRRISFALEGPFAYLPFSALHDGESVLAARFAISIRTGVGRRAALPSGASPSILLFGPQGAAADLGLELSRIAALSPAASWADSFTADGLADGLARAPGIVHVASHFHYAAGMPGRSYFALAEGERLTVSQFGAPRFDLSGVDLLVLAACESAVSESGEATLESVAAVAQAKGARCVLGTLWPVADASAATLMGDFYARLLAHSSRDAASIARALREAQHAMLQGCTGVPGAAHPYHWAGFVLFEPGG